MNPQLQQISAELDTAAERARAVVERIPVGLLGHRRNEKCWSVADCIEHLSLTTDAYLARIAPALEEARRAQRLSNGKAFRMGIATRLFAWWLEPPYRMKSKTSATFTPCRADPARALSIFIDRQRVLQAVVAKANGLDLDRIQITSPFDNLMKYNIYAAFSLIVAHQRRHLWQAEQVARTVAAEEFVQDVP